MDAEGKPQRRGPSVGDAPLSVTFHDDGALRIVTLSGAAELDQYESIREQLIGALAPGVRAYAVDLAELTFIGSPGLASLVEFRQRAAAAGARVWLARPRPTIARLLRLARLDQKLPLVASLEAARDQAANLG
jgi:anti-anti-sigma factor